MLIASIWQEKGVERSSPSTGRGSHGALIKSMQESSTWRFVLQFTVAFVSVARRPSCSKIATVVRSVRVLLVDDV